jgi:hypothetical protein
VGQIRKLEPTLTKELTVGIAKIDVEPGLAKDLNDLIVVTSDGLLKKKRAMRRVI